MADPTITVEVLSLSKLTPDGMKVLATKEGDLSNRVYTFSLGLVDAEDIMHWLEANADSTDLVTLEINPKFLIPVIPSWSAAYEPVSPTSRT